MSILSTIKKKATALYNKAVKATTPKKPAPKPAPKPVAKKAPTPAKKPAPKKVATPAKKPVTPQPSVMDKVQATAGKLGDYMKSNVAAKQAERNTGKFSVPTKTQVAKNNATMDMLNASTLVGAGVQGAKTAKSGLVNKAVGAVKGVTGLHKEASSNYLKYGTDKYSTAADVIAKNTTGKGLMDKANKDKYNSLMMKGLAVDLVDPASFALGGVGKAAKGLKAISQGAKAVDKTKDAAKQLGFVSSMKGPAKPGKPSIPKLGKIEVAAPKKATAPSKVAMNAPTAPKLAEKVSVKPPKLPEKVNINPPTQPAKVNVAPPTPPTKPTPPTPVKLPGRAGAYNNIATQGMENAATLGKTNIPKPPTPLPGRGAGAYDNIVGGSQYINKTGSPNMGALPNTPPTSAVNTLANGIGVKPNIPNPNMIPNANTLGNMATTPKAINGVEGMGQATYAGNRLPSLVNDMQPAPRFELPGGIPGRSSYDDMVQKGALNVDNMGRSIGFKAAGDNPVNMEKLDLPNLIDTVDTSEQFKYANGDLVKSTDPIGKSKLYDEGGEADEAVKKKWPWYVKAGLGAAGLYGVGSMVGNGEIEEPVDPLTEDAASGGGKGGRGRSGGGSGGGMGGGGGMANTGMPELDATPVDQADYMNQVAGIMDQFMNNDPVMQQMLGQLPNGGTIGQDVIQNPVNPQDPNAPQKPTAGYQDPNMNWDAINNAVATGGMTVEQATAEINTQLKPQYDTGVAQVKQAFMQKSAALKEDLASRGLLNSGVAAQLEMDLMKMESDSLAAFTAEHNGKVLDYAMQNMQLDQQKTQQLQQLYMSQKQIELDSYFKQMDHSLNLQQLSQQQQAMYMDYYQNMKMYAFQTMMDMVKKSMPDYNYYVSQKTSGGNYNFNYN